MINPNDLLAVCSQFARNLLDVRASGACACVRVRRMSGIAGIAFVCWAFGRKRMEIRRPYYCTAFYWPSEWQYVVADFHEFTCFLD